MAPHGVSGRAKKNMSENKMFESAVFAGGGNRCFWQAGFWAEAAPALELSPRVVAGVSAGATIASIALAGRTDETLRWFKAATAQNPRNFYPWNPLRGRPLFPHYAMYRAAILHALDPAAIGALHGGPDVRVLLARPPRWAGPRLAVAFGFGLYEIEKRVLAPVHPTWGVRAGFDAEVVSVRDCATPDDLADLLIASSCTPPFTPVQLRGGRPALDGGLVDNVPVAALDAAPGPTLVLLTRRYDPLRLASIPGRTYVQPSDALPVSKWDYTSPDHIQATFDLGRRDGERFARAAA